MIPTRAAVFWKVGLRYLTLLLACVFIAAGCGVSRPVHYYVLDPGGDSTPSPVSASPRFPIRLLVARVSSSHLYRDDRLVFGSGAVELGTFEYQRWAEPPTEMIQDALIAVLRANGDYRSVSAIGSAIRGEYILRGQLNSLAEVDKPEIAARFSIRLDLFDPRTGSVVWTDSYSRDEPVNGKAVANVVEALDQNVHSGLQQLAGSLGQYFMSHPAQPPQR
jgi:cholesterol transport system auxiliary component